MLIVKGDAPFISYNNIISRCIILSNYNILQPQPLGDAKLVNLCVPTGNVYQLTGHAMVITTVGIIVMNYLLAAQVAWGLPSSFQV